MKSFLVNNTKTFISLLSKLHEGVIIHAQDTSILYANPATTRILGLSEDELLGKNATNHEWYFINEEYEKIDLKDYPVNKLFNSDEIIQNQILGISLPNSTIKWVEINGSISRNEENENMALIVMNEVTDRKNAYDEAELFKHLVDTVNVGITISDPNQKDNPLIYTNKTFTQVTGYSPDEAIGKNCRFLQNVGDNQDSLKIIRAAIENESACEVEMRNYTKENKLFYNLLNISPLFKKGKLKYFIGVQHDITRQKKQENLLREQNMYIESILNAQNEIVFVSDGTKMTFANQLLYNFFNVSSLEMFLKKSSCLCKYFEKHDSYFHLGVLKENERWIEYVNNLPADKRIVCMKDTESKLNYFKISITKILDEKYVITLSNITSEIEKELILASKAYRDPLTSTYNRQYFYEYIVPKTLNSSSKFGVIISDIDDFKSINDVYGHSIGDEVIQTVVNTFNRWIRSNDSVIRWGGEEFVTIVEVNSLDIASSIAEKLRASIEAIDLKGVRRFTSSFGVSMLKYGENIDLAIQRADEALYIAKANGKNRVEVN